MTPDPSVYFVRYGMRLMWGLICIYLAKRKNKNIYVAFALGTILGIFAVIYYGVIAAKKSTSEQADYVKCKECGEIFTKTKMFCPSCKKEATSSTTSKVK